MANRVGFERFKNALQPKRLGAYDPACFASEQNFRAFVVEQAEFARRTFRCHGALPLVFCVYCTRDPHTRICEPIVYMVGPPPPDFPFTPQSKDLLAALATGTARFGEAICTVVISEVWTLQTQSEAEARHYRESGAGIHDHPQRIEALWFSVDHKTWPSAMGTAPITREVTGAVDVGAWKIAHAPRVNEGRFADLLPHTKGPVDA